MACTALLLSTRCFAFGEPMPVPANLERKVQIYATYYSVYLANEVKNGIALRDKTGRAHGPQLSRRDWCLGSVEGTIRLTRLNGSTETYNVSGETATASTSCAAHFRTRPDFPKALDASAFIKITAKFGLGASGLELVPYRSIAVDPKVIPLGTVLFVPVAKGVSFTDEDGIEKTHDGFFYAVDTGGAIKGRLIDFFVGTKITLIFPGIPHRQGNSGQTQFTDAFIVDDPVVKQALRQLHQAKP
jgi:3D (Asp-Asp-Asp) domain-containing protein